MNKTIAMITAGILAAGVLGIVSYTGNVWAAQSTGTADNTHINTEATNGLFGAPATGQAAASAWQNIPLTGQTVSSAASDHGTAVTASGNNNCGFSSSNPGSCAATHP